MATQVNMPGQESDEGGGRSLIVLHGVGGEIVLGEL
jgi:hypothetical protein